MWSMIFGKIYFENLQVKIIPYKYLVMLVIHPLHFTTFTYRLDLGRCNMQQLGIDPITSDMIQIGLDPIQDCTQN